MYFIVVAYQTTKGVQNENENTNTSTENRICHRSEWIRILVYCSEIQRTRRPAAFGNLRGGYTKQFSHWRLSITSLFYCCTLENNHKRKLTMQITDKKREQQKEIETLTTEFLQRGGAIEERPALETKGNDRIAQYDSLQTFFSGGLL
jgi:hypothetical protein